MELQQYLRILQRYWRSTLATTLLCIALAAGFTLLQTPSYTSTSSLFLTVDSGATAGELSQGANYAERTVTSYVRVASTALVLQPVIDELGLDLTPGQLANKLTVSSPSSTSIINVTASDEDPQLAATLADSVTSSLMNAVDELSPPAPDGTRLVMATVLDPARVATTPSAPRPAQNLALGGLLGLLLGAGQGLLRSVLDTRIRTSEDVAQVTDSPVLASIGSITKASGKERPNEGSNWAMAESYRRLRTNVGFLGLGGERRSSMVLTSSVAGEGKTETTINLARVLAHAGESVLLIDADLRRPQVAARMGLDSELGLSDVLTGRGTLQDLTIDVAAGYLSVLPAGTIPPNPSELLGSEAMAHLLATVERKYDYVLFDTPPLLPVTDALVLAAQTGGAILVARSGVVRRPQIESALHLLSNGDVDTLGLVLNDVPQSLTTYGDDYYYSHGRRRAAAAASH